MTFDPYHKLLGIAPKDQPPNHYRLLAIELFEADPEVIDAAANRLMAYLQQRATGKHAALSQKLLNEISAARVCLLNPRKKAEYDTTLRANLPGGPQEEAKPEPDLSEILDQFTEPQPSSSVLGPVRPDRARRSFRPEIWHYAVAIGAAVLLAIGAWAIFMTGGEPEHRTASTGTEQPTLSQRKEAMATPPPQAGSPPSKDKGQADPVAAEPKSSASPGAPSESKPSTWTPPVYFVTIEPPWANLEVKHDKVTVTGLGRQRQVRVDAPPGNGYLHLVLTCVGYEPKEEWLTPASGRDQEITVYLKSASEPEKDTKGAVDPGTRTVKSRQRPIRLFNGRDLEGWTVLYLNYSKSHTNGSWWADAEREVLASTGGDFNDLRTDRTFKDFTLTLEWRFKPGGFVGANGSGIIVRSTGLHPNGLDPRGIEVDLRPNKNERQGMGTGCFITYGTTLRNHLGYADGAKNRHLGWLREPEVRTGGPWNTCEIACEGDHIRVTMNGVLVNEGWGAEVVAGGICLRNQNTAVEFRNVLLIPED